jgi:hypothetical protein
MDSPRSRSGGLPDRELLGRTLVAIREDEIAAEAMGVHHARQGHPFVVSRDVVGGGLFALPDVHPSQSFTFLNRSRSSS